MHSLAAHIRNARFTGPLASNCLRKSGIGFTPADSSVLSAAIHRARHSRVSFP